MDHMKLLKGILKYSIGYNDPKVAYLVACLLVSLASQVCKLLVQFAPTEAGKLPLSRIFTLVKYAIFANMLL